MPQPILTLTTDFGLADHYVGVMKGVILGICPRARMVDISHEVTPFEMPEGAYLIAQAYRYFPKKTVHVVVVDPGVGTSRRPILMEAAGQYFVAPDNGVLSMIYSARKTQDPADLERAVFPPPGQPHVSWPRYLRSRGRAPGGRRSAGAHGQADRRLPAARFREAPADGKTHVDRPDSEDRPLRQHRHELPRGRFSGSGTAKYFHGDRARGDRVLAHNYAECGPGELFLIVGSSGYLEVSLGQGSAANRSAARRARPRSCGSRAGCRKPAVPALWGKWPTGDPAEAARGHATRCS